MAEFMHVFLHDLPVESDIGAYADWFEPGTAEAPAPMPAFILNKKLEMVKNKIEMAKSKAKAKDVPRTSGAGMKAGL